MREAGGSVVVITAKLGRLARTHLDHVADVRSAIAAGPGVSAVGVATGPCQAAELLAAGAHVVLSDLTLFSDWLIGRRGGATAESGDHGR